MSISAESVRFDDDAMWVTLSDGRVLGVPLAWFPRLLHADARAGRLAAVTLRHPLGSAGRGYLGRRAIGRARGWGEGWDGGVR